LTFAASLGYRISTSHQVHPVWNPAPFHLIDTTEHGIQMKIVSLHGLKNMRKAELNEI